MGKVTITPAKKIEAKPVGRPTEYNQETATILCEHISGGMSLRTACDQDGMPVRATFFKWMRENPEFLNQYARACEERTEAFAEDILSISDEGIGVIKAGAEKKSGAIAQIVRLQVDTRKWMMSKMKPKKYGDKLDLTSDGKPIPAPIYGGQSVAPTDPIV